MDAKIFSLIKKYKKSNTIGFESVPLIIKIGVFLVKKEHNFSGFPHIFHSLSNNVQKYLKYDDFFEKYLQSVSLYSFNFQAELP